MKANHALIHDTFTLERRYPSAPTKVYRYFSEPEHRKRWSGVAAWLPGVVSPISVPDCRIGRQVSCARAELPRIRQQ